MAWFRTIRRSLLIKLFSHFTLVHSILGNGEVRRITLELTPSGYIIKGFNQGRSYPTIAHLVAAHCSQTTNLPCLLRLPGYNTNPNTLAVSSTTPVSSILSRKLNPSLRNRYSGSKIGINDPLNEHQAFSPFPRTWARRIIGSNEPTGLWIDQIPVPPVPPHRTANANERARRQTQRPVCSLLPQGAGKTNTFVAIS